ncbi:CAP domain-containing protein [Candidatus Woesearchaeota archaeon]|jgi:uncharacterized protein YkwD|nr:CAP domain-containing protein [Candidatus Woesearchaeota archaeon]MBT6995426.1 CAP domain-containing protein [Candidatus Woesearchaeota archaeon]MBT7237618.1 CAP domain-containing protein [Candidatus Woesearchaeota archaeon]
MGKTAIALIIIIGLVFLYNSDYINQDEIKDDLKGNEITGEFFIEAEERIDDFFSSEPISDKTFEVEKRILHYTNIQRAERGLSILIWDSHLGDIARDHSLDMIERDFFEHNNPEGEDPTARAIDADYNVHKELSGGWYSEGIGENIGSMPTGSVEGFGYVSSDADSIAEAHVNSWMESPGHRANILEPGYDRLGVGVAYDGIYYMATQNFW